MAQDVARFKDLGDLLTANESSCEKDAPKYVEMVQRVVVSSHSIISMSVITPSQSKYVLACDQSISAISFCPFTSFEPSTVMVASRRGL